MLPLGSCPTLGTQRVGALPGHRKTLRLQMGYAGDALEGIVGCSVSKPENLSIAMRSSKESEYFLVLTVAHSPTRISSLAKWKHPSALSNPAASFLSFSHLAHTARRGGEGAVSIAAQAIENYCESCQPESTYLSSSDVSEVRVLFKLCVCPVVNVRRSGFLNSPRHLQTNTR